MAKVKGVDRSRKAKRVAFGMFSGLEETPPPEDDDVEATEVDELGEDDE